MLSASLIPEQPFYQNVTWKDQENGKNLRLSSTGTHGEECKVTVRYDENGQEHPAWIQNVVNADDQKWKEDLYGKRSGTASYSEMVTATSEDQTNGVITAQCQVTVNFRTLDQTVVHPESVAITPGQVSFDLYVKKTGTRYAVARANQGFEPVQAASIVKPVFSADQRPEEYNDQVQWSLSDDQCIALFEVIDGADVDYIYPEEGTVVVVDGTAIRRGCAHEEAAKQFLEFTISRDAQEILVSDLNHRSVRRDVAPLEGLVPMAKLPIISAGLKKLSSEKEEALTEWKQVMEGGGS